MADIKFPPITEILRRRLQADSAPSLGETIVPTIELEGSRPEYAYYAGERLCNQTLVLSYTGTNIQHCGIFSPSDDLIVTVESIHGYNFFLTGAGIAPTAPPSLFRDTGASGSLNLAANMRDLRWDSVGAGSLRGMARMLTLSAAAASGTPFGLTFPTAWGSNTAQTQWACGFRYTSPIVLAGSDGIWAAFQPPAAASAGSALVVNFAWRERTASAWEKASALGI